MDTFSNVYTIATVITIAIIIIAVFFYKKKKKQIIHGDTPIEKRLYQAILDSDTKLPEPQHKIFINGKLVTIPDFAYTSKKVAIFCDGYAYHCNQETLISDANKRNSIAIEGWIVLVFWGRQINNNPEQCAQVIAKALKSR